MYTAIERARALFYGGYRPSVPLGRLPLARLRDASSRDVAEYLATRGAFRSPTFRVSRFVLMSSRASMGGGPYVVEAAYPLAATTFSSKVGSL